MMKKEINKIFPARNVSKRQRLVDIPLLWSLIFMFMGPSFVFYSGFVPVWPYLLWLAIGIYTYFLVLGLLEIFLLQQLIKTKLLRIMLLSQITFAVSIFFVFFLCCITLTLFNPFAEFQWLVVVVIVCGITASIFFSKKVCKTNKSYLLSFYASTDHDGYINTNSYNPSLPQNLFYKRMCTVCLSGYTAWVTYMIFFTNIYFSYFFHLAVLASVCAVSLMVLLVCMYELLCILPKVEKNKGSPLLCNWSETVE